jgi:hypothetical protein
MKLKNKLPDLQNAFGALELDATDPEKQRQLEERLRSDENLISPHFFLIIPIFF